MLISTYWPSGNSREALSTRKHTEATITDLLNSQACTPILLGDMNATLTPQDRSSHTCFEQDRSYRKFISHINLCPIDWHLPTRPWTYRSCIANQSQETNRHTHSRIDDILLPSHICKTNTTRGHPQLLCFTDDKGYRHSNHIPLIANIPTVILGARIKRLQQPAITQQPERVLVRPIKPSDLEKLHCALKDPAYTPYISHTRIQETLNTMHTSALSHLSSIHDTCAKQQTRLTHLNGVPAKRAVEDMASRIVQLIKECHDVALQVCTTKVKTRNSKHFESRRVNNLRKSLCNQLKAVRYVQYNLSHTHLMQPLEDALTNNSQNPNLCKAILFLQKCANKISQTNTSISTPPAETIISGLHKSLKDQIHKIDVEYNIQCNLRAKR